LGEPHTTRPLSGPPLPKDLPTAKQPLLLTTKVIPPRLSGLIDRPRLLGIISQLPAKRLAVIKAPAGFGKTSLAVAWSERLGQSGNSIAWLSIDSDDNEPSRLLFYVAQALQRACEGVGVGAIALLHESFLISQHAILSTLINDLAEIDEEVYLFLDDYHWVTDPAIHEAVEFFLRHAPSHCHVVLTSRAEPPLPLASLRAQNQLVEIDGSALRFDLQETRAFVEQNKPDTLDFSDVQVLYRKTEGWPAALRIVVSTSSRSSRDFGQYVHDLSGTLRPVGAYLAEMLDGLPRDLVLFMVRTAILDRISAPLAEAVTGAISSGALIRSIEKRQLLLSALDQEGRWYRFHPLLAGYLKQRLESELADEIPRLHERASLWYAAQDLWTDAVQHAIAAGATDLALGWIKNCAMTLVKKGDLFTLLDWQRLFPTELMRSQLEVRLAIAWGLALAIRPDEALQLLSEIEHDIGTKGPAGGDGLADECRAIRSVAISLKDDGGEALPLAQQCLNKSTDPWTANVASNVVRYWRLKAGDLNRFYATPWIPYSLEEDRRNVFASVYRRCIQGMAEAQQIRLAAAERYYTEALQLAEQHVGPSSVAAALPASLISQIRYEQGRLEEAEAMLIDRVSLISAGAMLECVWGAYFVMTRVAAFRMNHERAYTLLERAENLGTTRGWGRLAGGAVAERARLYINEGRLSEAAACLDRLERLAVAYPASTSCAWSDIDWYAKLTRAYLASSQERLDEAMSILRGLQRETESANNHYFALRVAIQLALVRFSANQVTQSFSGFRDVLNVSAQAGIHQTVMDEGPGIGALLTDFQEHAERTGSSRELLPYVGRLIACWRSRYQSDVQPAAKSAISEPLSAREDEILKLIAQGLSNKEIGRTLMIAPETVKSHVKHIFIKMGVEKRAQAVSRAQSLGLVSTH
jgi:LuxR family transcriptional regulator, maltose regulon positive regulatory protein